MIDLIISTNPTRDWLRGWGWSLVIIICIDIIWLNQTYYNNVRRRVRSNNNSKVLLVFFTTDTNYNHNLPPKPHKDITIYPNILCYRHLPIH